MNIIPYKSVFVRRKTSTDCGTVSSKTIYRVCKWRGEGVFEVETKIGRNWVCSSEYWEDVTFEENLQKILEE